MKTLGIILLTAIIFAVIVVGALFGVLGYINEETEVKSREESGAYLRNFSTFLNNLPDPDEGGLF